MKPVARLNALGFSAPIPADYQANSFATALAGVPSSNANLTWGVQHSFDDPGPDGQRGVVLSQTTTVITVTGDFGLATYGSAFTPGLGHGLSVGDSVVLKSNVAGLSGHFPVASIVSQSSYTLTSAVSQSATDNFATANAFRWFNHATMTNQTGRLDGNYAFPPRAIRLNVTAYVAGYVDLLILQASGR